MVKNAVSVSAYAKINLHLEVLKKRDDGFHNLVSIFSPISLCDELLIEKTERTESCQVFSPCFDLPSQNSLSVAYDEFCKETGVLEGISIKLIKNIPVGAGLGGGSSDAASLLVVLNNLFDTKLSTDKLKEIGLRVGSDVPFFIAKSPALVTGRGELIKPISIKTDYFGVLVFPEIESSTKKAYSLLDKVGLSSDAKLKPEKYCGLDCREWPFFNSFEDVIFKEYSEIKEAKSLVLALGADFALMSGTGSSVFGLFKDKKMAKIAYYRLLREYKSTFLFFLLAF